MSEYVLVSDIHGNAPALEAVIEREVCQDKQYIVLGDIHGLNGFPQQTQSIVQAAEHAIAGNHDKAIFHNNEGHVNSDKFNNFEKEHTLSQLTDEQQEWMENLPFMDVFQDGDSRIAIAHSYPYPEKASGYEMGNAGVKKGHIPSVGSAVSDEYDWVFLGHTHTQYDVDVSKFGGAHDVHFVNPGSLGWHQTYSTLNTDTGEIEHKSVTIDTDEIIEHVDEHLYEGIPPAREWLDP